MTGNRELEHTFVRSCLPYLRQAAITFGRLPAIGMGAEFRIGQKTLTMKGVQALERHGVVPRETI